MSNPDRVAPTKDPAYYTWRTEALISEDPVTLLEVEGAFDMFAGGYRVTAPVIGGFLRQIPGISTLNVTVFLMVITPVLTALLLGGFAFRHRRDPLIFHSVAIGSASLFLTPPFVGYLDNVLTLMFLAAALFFIDPARKTWTGRIGLLLFLLASGFTHPTTLAIFCVTLGAISVVRLIFRRFDLRSVIRDDGAMLATAFSSAVLTFLIWQVGIWGKSASLGEAALPPPYGSDFFVDRMMNWIEVMNPILNLPLFVIGVVGLLIAGKRAAEDELSVVSLVWLAPLAGLFGFVGGLTYPYYRFFNTTLAWVLLVGIGSFFFIRFASGRGPIVTIIAALAMAFIFGANFNKGFASAGWNDPEKGWLSDEERTSLDALRNNLASEDLDRPVVFVIDDRPGQEFQIWGFTKLSGNTSRYGMPRGQIDRAYLYLGDLYAYQAGLPTEMGEETYDKLSPALLEDAEAGIAESGQEPLVVLADIFNKAGANKEIAAGDEVPPAGLDNLLVITDGTLALDGEVIGGGDGTFTFTQVDDSGLIGADGLLHLVIAIFLLALLLVPGLLALRILPDASLPEALGLAPTFAIVLLSLVGIGVLAIFRSPFSAGLAVLAYFGALIAGGLMYLLANRSRPAAGN